MTKLNAVTRDVEFRSSTEGDGRTLEGYAAVFGQDAEIDSWEGAFVERIAYGAFTKTLRDKTPVLQWQHGFDPRVGHVPIGAFTVLREDRHGLFVTARLFDNDVVEPVRQAIEARAITGMSFKFRVLRDEWTDKDGRPLSAKDVGHLLYAPGTRGPLRRTIKEVQLFEAGPVLTPAYAGTSIGVRSAEHITKTIVSTETARRLLSYLELS